MNSHENLGRWWPCLFFDRPDVNQLYFLFGKTEQQAQNFPTAPPPMCSASCPLHPPGVWVPLPSPPLHRPYPPPGGGHGPWPTAQARSPLGGDGGAGGDAVGVIRKCQPWPSSAARLSLVCQAGQACPPPCNGNGAHGPPAPLSVCCKRKPGAGDRDLPFRRALLGCHNTQPTPQEVETVFL